MIIPGGTVGHGPKYPIWIILNLHSFKLFATTEGLFCVMIRLWSTREAKARRSIVRDEKRATEEVVEAGWHKCLSSSCARSTRCWRPICLSSSYGHPQFLHCIPSYLKMGRPCKKIEYQQKDIIKIYFQKTYNHPNRNSYFFGFLSVNWFLSIFLQTLFYFSLSP